MSQQERLTDLLKQADEHSASRCITDYDEATADNAAFLLENNVTILPAKAGDTVYLVYGGNVAPATVNYIISMTEKWGTEHEMHVVIIDGYYEGTRLTARLYDDPNIRGHNVCRAYKDRETAEKVCQEEWLANRTEMDQRKPNTTGWEGFCNGY